MNQEKIYDDQIAPLMTQIIKIAKEHDMPFVFSFQLTGNEDEDGPLLCSSHLLPDGCEEKLVQAAEILSTPPSTSTLTLTVRDAEGLITAIEHIIIQEEGEKDGSTL